MDRDNNKFKQTELPAWLKSKYYFNEATKLIKDIRAEIKQVLVIKKLLMI